jgi:hypothetical protein
LRAVSLVKRSLSGQLATLFRAAPRRAVVVSGLRGLIGRLPLRAELRPAIE